MVSASSDERRGVGSSLAACRGLGAAQALPDPPRGDRQPAALTAPRIAPLPEAQWTDEHRRLAARYARDGRADNQLHTLLNVPAIAEGLMAVAVYLTEQSIDAFAAAALTADPARRLAVRQPADLGDERGPRPRRRDDVG